jgi:hypothetical protein
VNDVMITLTAEGRRSDGKGSACKGDKDEVAYTVDQSYQLTSSDNKQQFTMFGTGIGWSDMLLCM